MTRPAKKRQAVAAAPTRSLDDTPITLIGHPWAPIGMGEQMRSHVAALSALHLHHQVFDIFRYAGRTDAEHDRIIGDRETRIPPDGIRIFHINGDEVDNVRTAFEARGGTFADGHNIIVPAWELPRYPMAWVEHLRQFDEVWALSRFIQDSLAASGVKSHLIGQSVQVPPGPLLPRRHFGIRESAFVLLNFFDLSSYASRKNPEAVLGLFARIRTALPDADIQLVLKAKQGEGGAESWAREFTAAHPGTQIHIIDQMLDTRGVRSLIAACDCFVSLHRAEGFGRGLGEAMAAGRLAMGTNWSGNTDFLNAGNGLAVNADTVALCEGDYPHWQGQVWAEPDLDHAETLLKAVLSDPRAARALARKGQIDVLASHGDRAVGLRILDRLEAIVASS
jgi:glycosyltransferase involved in cell wall biosynthesis